MVSYFAGEEVYFATHKMSGDGGDGVNSPAIALREKWDI